MRLGVFSWQNRDPQRLAFCAAGSPRLNRITAECFAGLQNHKMTIFTQPKVLRLQANENGRDLALGVARLGVQTISLAMKKVGFDPKVDRLFLFGDILEREPDPVAACSFLAQPSIYSVRGRRDHALLSLYSHALPGISVVHDLAPRFGFGWFSRLSQNDRLEVIQHLGKQPLAMEVKTARGTVGFVHSAVPPGIGWAAFMHHVECGVIHVIDELLDGVAMRAQACRKDLDFESPIYGIGRVFCFDNGKGAAPGRHANVFGLGHNMLTDLMTSCPGFDTLWDARHLCDDGDDSLLACTEHEEGIPFGPVAGS